MAQAAAVAAYLLMLLALLLPALGIVLISPWEFLFMAGVAGLAAAFELQIATELSRHKGMAGMRGRLFTANVAQ